MRISRSAPPACKRAVIELLGASASTMRSEICGGRARQLYLVEPISCRRCVRPLLDYGSRYGDRRSAPSAARIARLRRQIGAPEWPVPLPPRPPSARGRYGRLWARLEAEEAKLVASFASLSSDLERRLRSWRQKRRKGYSRTIIP
jgi:hypothetical protein